MFGLGDWMYNVLGPDSAFLVVIFVFLIFFIDALVFPTLPELFFILGLMYYDPISLTFGVQLLIAAAVAEIVGSLILYYVVKRARIPGRIRRILDKYVNLLICKDERMLLLNRIAPMIPYSGAFVALIDSWKLPKSMFYITLGCLLKYGVIMLMSGFFFIYFSSGDAQTYTILFVLIVIAVSLMAAFLRKRKEGVTNENC